jgi:hypothetical protein
MNTNRSVKALSGTESDRQRVRVMLDTLNREYILSPNTNARKGGLLAIAATAIAFGPVRRLL